MVRFLIILFLFSCTKSVEKVDKPTSEVCDFGTLNIQAKRVVKKATGVLYLDFNGEYVSGTSWNWNGDINCLPSGLDSSQIQSVLDSVKAKYNRFKVIVTTNESLYNTAPVNERQRIIITESFEWFGQAGGVAFLGSYSWGDNTPCFVFSSLLSYNLKNISEAVAHEAGHTLGLRHQSICNGSTLSQTYNSGSGLTAPIMGISYNKNGVWWVGMNNLCFQQDDMNLLSQKIPLLNKKDQLLNQ